MPLRLDRQLSEPPPVEATRLQGQYALPVAAPDLAGDRPMVRQGSWLSNDEAPLRLFSGNTLVPGFGFWLQLLLVVTFLCLDSSRYMLDVWALRSTDKARSRVLAQTLVFVQTAAGFLSAVTVTGAMEGCSGLRKAFEWREVLRCIWISIGFALSQAAFTHAYARGIGPATAVALGFLYMPLCALISRWMFSRAYGWLETYALVLLTLSILAFSELRSRAISLTEGMNGAALVLISVVLSCFSSLLAEWVLKSRHETARAEPFYMQKVRLEVWGLLTGAILLYLIADNPTRCIDYWDYRATTALVVRVVQGWMAGIIAKHLSTVAKAVMQCMSLLIVFFLGDLVFFKVGTTNLKITLLAFVVALSALLYQIGRQQTMKSLAAQRLEAQRLIEQQQLSSATPSRGAPAEPDTGGAGSLTPSPPFPQRALSDMTDYGRSARAMLLDLAKQDTDGGYMQEVNVLAPSEFESLAGRNARPRLTQWLHRRMPRLRELRLLDGAWLRQAWVYNANLASWAVSQAGIFAQLTCVATFILSDASRTIIYEWSISGTAIVQQSVVVASSAVAVVVGVICAGVLDGRTGVLTSLSPKQVMRCLPVAFCFSLGQTAQIYAYGLGISAVENTVIGYAYMPLSALLSRWIFRRAYSSLEWLALTLLVLSASVFVLMQDGSSGSAPMNPVGIMFVLGAVCLSCLGSILAEKIMKAGHNCPFYIQKVHLEVGSLFTAVLMLFISGVLSNRPNDAFWKKRDTGGGHMEAGIFVAWSSKTVAALVATVLQSWLGGLVAKRLSTVTRAVAQCLSLLLIYFVGDLVLKHLAFDWPVGSMAIVVALTVQVFAQAGKLNPHKGERRTVEEQVSQARSSSRSAPTAPADDSCARGPGEATLADGAAPRLARSCTGGSV